MISDLNDCTLRIDRERGVIYVDHAEETILRICSLPRPIPAGVMLDVTHMVGASWRERLRVAAEPGRR
jgi:hypothetical protein